MIPLLGLLAAAPDLPQRLELKSPTEAFGADYDLALREGKLWWRARPGGAWQVLPPDGLPAPKGRGRSAFKPPAALAALSADGDNLVALTAEGAVYYTKLSTLEWTDAWGPPGLKGPLVVEPGARVAMSHRKIPYRDLDGNPHPVTAGVTTLYALSADGRTLAYADPWLPPTWDHRLCLPLRGRFVAAALAASASTVLVMDASGRAFTRLADFDTVGDDPALPYSYARERRSGPRSVVRTLPGEDWREQPRVPGPHTARLTLVQDGRGNADRELRVEGEGGYWAKHLEEPRWQFVKTGAARGGALVDARAAPLGPDQDRTLASAQKLLGAAASLERFNPDCAPATLKLTRDGETVALELHFHGGLEVVEQKERRFKGALLLPEGKGALLDALRAWASGRGFLEVEVRVGGTVRVKDLAALSRFELEFSR